MCNAGLMYTKLDVYLHQSGLIIMEESLVLAIYRHVRSIRDCLDSLLVADWL